MSHNKVNEEQKEKAEKRLSMEEKTPTMPMMFTKQVQIIAKRLCRQGIFYDAECRITAPPQCPHCRGTHIYVHGSYKRRVQYCNQEGGVRRLSLSVKRYKCRCCGRTFGQDCSSIGLARYARRNSKLNSEIAAAFRMGGSNKAISKRYGISASTVERTIHADYGHRLRQRVDKPVPRYLGIDEHSIHRGGKYAVTLVDLEKHSVYEVIEGKRMEILERRIRVMKGRAEVKLVCMDLCTAFRSLAQRLFPNAKVVADRFHVMRLIIDTFMEFCREAAPEIRWQRGITMCLRKHGRNLTTNQRKLLSEVLSRNEVIKTAYDFKEELCSLLSLKSRKMLSCRKPLRRLKKMVDMLLHDAPAIFQTLGKTLRSWFEPIIRMWRFTKSNGITEGFHRKMKLIQRRAYGYRNFENYRLRVLIECGDE